MCVWFSRTNSSLCIYHLFVWSNLSCFFFVFFFAQFPVYQLAYPVLFILFVLICVICLLCDWSFVLYHHITYIHFNYYHYSRIYAENNCILIFTLIEKRKKNAKGREMFKNTKGRQLLVRSCLPTIYMKTVWTVNALNLTCLCIQPNNIKRKADLTHKNVICALFFCIIHFKQSQIYFLLRINAHAKRFGHTLTNQRAERIDSIFLLRTIF